MTDPSRRDRTRPAELLALSGILAVVVGVITFFGTRDLLLAAEFAVVSFIVALIGFAMLLLTVAPKRDDDSGPDDHGPVDRSGH